MVRTCCVFYILTSNVLRATTACTFSTLKLPKVVRRGVFAHFDFEMSFATKVHFLNISASKSGLNVVWFAHFDFEVCFAPQRRAVLEHLEQKILVLMITVIIMTLMMNNVKKVVILVITSSTSNSDDDNNASKQKFVTVTAMPTETIMMITPATGMRILMTAIIIVTISVFNINNKNM